MAIQAKRAERHKLKVKMALMGPSGSGKSYSALRLAVGFGGRVLLGNTEAERGYLYADRFEYDIADVDAPFTPEKYIELIEYAERQGYDTLIIDSGSHEWSGRGGILEIHEKIPGNNSYANWTKVTPRHNAFVDKILYAKLNIIVCLRGKDQYVLEENSKGKQEPKKVGLGSEQRANFEYELMLTLMIDQKSHIATVMKDNTGGIFNETYEVLSEDHGRRIMEWANSGTAIMNLTPPPVETPAPTPAPTRQQPSTSQPAGNGGNLVAEIMRTAKDAGCGTMAELKNIFQAVTGSADMNATSEADRRKVLAKLHDMIAKQNAADGGGDAAAFPEMEA